ncbi:MAG: hypothetical protein JWP85_580 [Rhodoglobus sp.]|nr:hypothetical protein [Rhodoglobus sp.]
MQDLLTDAVSRLAAAVARDELLVDYVRPTWLGVKLAAKLVPVERVWRLGVLLLGRSGTLYATGTTLRVTEPRHPNAQSRLAEDRRELRAIALRSGISGGETINLDAHDIVLGDLGPDSRPIAAGGDGFTVAWSATSATRTPLETYLEERVQLLIDPPEGA